jgi:hypothetical protein
MDPLLVGFIIFDVVFLVVVYRFMVKKLKGKLAQVEERQAARWDRDDDEARERYLEQVQEIRPGLKSRDENEQSESVDDSGRPFISENPEAQQRYSQQLSGLTDAEE